jgi:ADP-ribose pyrophosphatase
MQVFADTLKKLTDLRWLNLFEIEFQNEKGGRGKWEFVSRKRHPVPGPAPLEPDAVFIVPILKTPLGNRLVMLREFRVPLGDYEISVPAGLQEPGESVETTARRELKEETGLTLTKVLAVSPPVVSTAGMSDESVAIAFVECTGEPGTTGADHSEEIEVLILDYDAVVSLRRSGAKFAAKAWCLLLMFEALGEIAWHERLS